MSIWRDRSRGASCDAARSPTKERLQDNIEAEKGKGQDFQPWPVPTILIAVAYDVAFT